MNDGSSDDTMAILESIEDPSDDCTIVIDGFPANRGRGAAVRRGFSRSTGDYVIALDADLSYDESHITRILETFASLPITDVVVVSPYMPGGRSEGVPWRRLVISKVANKILARFLHRSIRTVTCVVRGYRGDFIRGLPLFNEGKGIHLEILRTSILRGARIEEIPGQLIWNKPEGGGPRRKTNLKFVNAAGSHLTYGFLVQPVRIIALFAVVLTIVTVWESIAIGSVTISEWGETGSWTKRLWEGLASAFEQSPHSFFILGLSAILGFQFTMFSVLLSVMRFHHAESTKYLLDLCAKQQVPRG